MLRCYDLVVSRGFMNEPGDRRPVKWLIPCDCVLDINPIYNGGEEFWGITVKENGLSFSYDGYLRATPPWHSVWMEFCAKDGKIGNSYGIHLLTVFSKDREDNFKRLLEDFSMSIDTKQKIESAMADLDHEVPGWDSIIHGNVIVSVNETMPKKIYSTQIVLDTEGKFIRGDWGRHFRAFGLDDELVEYIDGKTGEVVQAEDMRITMLNALTLKTLELLNVRNITTEVVQPDPTKVRRLRKRHKPPTNSYRILKIKPMQRRVQKVIDPNAPVSVKPDEYEDFTAFHMARGHFKTYTEERPLFGKLVGTWWWAPHMRGNPDHGVITKDYEIEV